MDKPQFYCDEDLEVVIAELLDYANAGQAVSRSACGRAAMELQSRTIPELVGLKEIAEMRGVSKSMMVKLAREDPNFPEPALQLAMGNAWRLSEINAYFLRRSVRGS